MRGRILVIENDPWLSDHYVRLLRLQGYKVQHESNGHSAMSVIDKSQPAAIIMNLALNGSSPIALLHEMQSYIDTAVIPIVAYTKLQDVFIEDLHPYGVRRLLYSPIMQPDDILAALRSVLHENNSM